MRHDDERDYLCSYGWLFIVGNAVGRILPYIIGGCIIGLLISNLWKVL